MEKRKLIRASACRRTGTLKELQEHPEKTDHFLHGKKKLLYSSDCFWSCLGYLNKPKLPQSMQIKYIHYGLMRVEQGRTFYT